MTGTASRSTTTILVVAVLGIVLGLPTTVVLLLGGGAGCSATANAGQLSSSATDQLPGWLPPIIEPQAARWNIDVAFLASIAVQETGGGTNALTNVVNSAGCVGVMQLGTGGRCGNFWGENQCDGDGDGRMDVLDPADNVCAAAKGLRQAKGAPPAGGSYDGYYQAACGYYGKCADASANYAQEVMARAVLFGFAAGTVTDATSLTKFVDDDQGGAAISGGCDPAAGSTDVMTVDGPRGVVLPSGEAAAPAGAPAAVRAMFAAGNRINRFSYVYGGGHAPGASMDQTRPRPAGGGYDCSSAVSYLLWAGGMGRSFLRGAPMDSTSMMSAGLPGRGRWVTVYANPEHAWIVVAGIAFDTNPGTNAPNPPSSGPKWATTPDPMGVDAFTVRHPEGL